VGRVPNGKCARAEVRFRREAVDGGAAGGRPTTQPANRGLSGLIWFRPQSRHTQPVWLSRSTGLEVKRKGNDISRCPVPTATRYRWPGPRRIADPPLLSAVLPRCYFAVLWSV